MKAEVVLELWRLTFDLSGPCRTAKPAGTGPLEGVVRQRACDAAMY